MIEGKEYKDNIQGAGATIQNMLLAAHSLGLGACWICRLPSQDTMRKMFKVPKDLDVVAYLAIGYPDFVPKSVPRKYNLEETTSSNTFEGKTTKSSIKRQLYLMAPTPLKLFYRLCVEGRFFRKFNCSRGIRYYWF